jgi:hypothetical protein
MRYVLGLAFVVGCATGPSPAERAQQQRAAAEYRARVDAHNRWLAACAAATRAPETNPQLARQCLDWAAAVRQQEETAARERAEMRDERLVRAAEEQARAAKQASDLAAFQAVMQATQPPQPAPAPPPAAPSRSPVSCTTTNIAGTLYTNCY